MKFFQTSSPCYNKHTFCNRFDRFRKVEKIMMTDRAIPPGDCGGEIQAQLQAMAEEIVSRITALDAPVSTEQLLGGLVSELFLTAAKERQRAERRRRQAEGIAEAKAKGVRFGPSPKPLPGNFESCCKAWRDGELSLTEAADRCGMARASFRRAVMRREQAGSCAG